VGVTLIALISCVRVIYFKNRVIVRWLPNWCAQKHFFYMMRENCRVWHFEHYWIEWLLPPCSASMWRNLCVARLSWVKNESLFTIRMGEDHLRYLIAFAPVVYDTHNGVAPPFMWMWHGQCNAIWLFACLRGGGRCRILINLHLDIWLWNLSPYGN